MARLFDDAASDTATVDAAAVTAYPLTMACWMYTDAVGAIRYAMWLGDKDASNQWFSIGINTSADPDVIATARDGGAARTATTTGLGVANAWQHACGVFTDATSRTVYRDGANSATNATAATPVGIDRTSIGYSGDSSPSFYWSGRLAECAIWNIALSATQVAALARGISPLRIRPDAIVFYAPLMGIGSPEPDYTTNGNHLTLSGTAVADHPSVSRSFGFDTGWQDVFAISSVAGSQTVNVGAASMAINANAATIVPGAATVNVATATMPITANSATIQATRTLLASVAQMGIKANPATVTPGATTVTVGTAEVAIKAQPATITTGATTVTVGTAKMPMVANPATATVGALTVSVGVAKMPIKANAVTVTPGAVTITVGTAKVAFKANAASVSAGAQIVSVGTAQVAVVANPATVTPGATTIAVDTAVVAMSANAASVLFDQTVSVGVATIAMLANAATPTVGEVSDLTPPLTSPVTDPLTSVSITSTLTTATATATGTSVEVS